MSFTEQQLEILAGTRVLLPDNWNLHVSDAKVIAYADLVLSDINLFPPLTNFTTQAGVPLVLKPVLYFGISVFTEMFQQMRASLEDFDFNDNGLTVHVDQVGKINTSMVNLLEVYKNMIVNAKKIEIFGGISGVAIGAGLGSPRYQTQLGQFLAISLGKAFQWGHP